MSGLTCRNCGPVGAEAILTERIDLARGGYHLKASCGKCGTYLKFLPHGEPTLYFGRYTGRLISEIAMEDREYLYWLLTTDLKPTVKTRIQEALDATAG